MGTVEILRIADAEQRRTRGRLDCPAAHRVPDDRWPDGVRQLFTADQPALPGAGRRAAAAHRDEPRRTDGGGVLRPRDRPSCSRAAATRSSTSTTAAPPATAGSTASASRASGGSSTSTTASPARVPRRAGPRRWRAARDPRRPAPAASRRSPRSRSRDNFEAGCTYFGIGDLRAFVKDTHKFESRYLESLVGPWPEAQQLYLERSPSLHAEQDHGARAGPAGRRRQGRAPVRGGGADRRRAVRAAMPHAYLLYGRGPRLPRPRRDHPLVRRRS